MRATSAVHRQRGFTLMELVITLVLMGILGTWGSSMIIDNFRTVQIVNASQASADHARYAIERLAREIREVKYVNLATGYAISSTMAPSATGMVFTRTIDGVDVAVTINKSGTDLTLGHTLPAAVTSTVATNVSGFTLDFLTLQNTATTLKTDLRFVVISLTVTDATSGQQVTERTRVALRNS